jgi:hypothetical protein
MQLTPFKRALLSTDANDGSDLLLNWLIELKACSAHLSGRKNNAAPAPDSLWSSEQFCLGACTAAQPGVMSWEIKKMLT